MENVQDLKCASGDRTELGKTNIHYHGQAPNFVIKIREKILPVPASQKTGLRKLRFSSLFFYILSSFSPVIIFDFLNSYILFLLLVIIAVKDQLSDSQHLNSFVIHTTKGIFLAESRSIHLNEPKSILVCVIQEFVLKD